MKSTTYSISANANTSYYYQWENFANYNGTFGKHAVSAMAGMSYTENNSDNVSASASGSDILKDYKDNFKYLNYLKSGDGIAKNMTTAIAFRPTSVLMHSTHQDFLPIHAGDTSLQYLPDGL